MKTRALLSALISCGCAAGAGVIVPAGEKMTPYGAALCLGARAETGNVGGAVSYARIDDSLGLLASDLVFLEGYYKHRVSETMNLLVGGGKAFERAEFDGSSFKAGSAFLSLGVTGKVMKGLDVRISCAFLLESTNVAYTGFLLLEHPF